MRAAVKRPLPLIGLSLGVLLALGVALWFWVGRDDGARSTVPFAFIDASEDDPPPSPDGLEITLGGIGDTPVVQDSVARFNIELRNATDSAVELDPCPAYYLVFGESGTSSSITSYLNCEEAPSSIEPKETVSFEMELELSPDMAEGFSGTLHWGFVEEPFDEGANAVVELVES